MFGRLKDLTFINYQERVPRAKLKNLEVVILFKVNLELV